MDARHMPKEVWDTATYVFGDIDWTAHLDWFGRILVYAMANGLECVVYCNNLWDFDYEMLFTTMVYQLTRAQ